MTPLRQKMIDTMVLKGLSPATQQAYLYAVSKVARHFKRSPDSIDVGDLERYVLHLLTDQHLAPASVRLMVNGMRFLNHQVLQRPAPVYAVRYPTLPQRIPALLTRQEVAQILAATANLKHATIFATGYALGLRASELLHLQVADIDSTRHWVQVRQGKGGKDRTVILPDTLLQWLRRYWQVYRPREWLFYGAELSRPLDRATLGKAFHRAKAAAGIQKQGGLHSLRHAYATHQLEAGMPTYKLQQLLGHSDIKSTLRYVHWLPTHVQQGNLGSDLLHHCQAVRP